MLVDTAVSSRHMFEKSKSSTTDHTIGIVGDYRGAVANDVFPIDIKEGTVEFSGEEKDVVNQGPVDKGDAQSVMNGLDAIKAVTMTKQINEELSVNVQDKVDLRDESTMAIGINNIEPTTKTTETTTELNKQQPEYGQEASKEQVTIKGKEAISTANLDQSSVASPVETASAPPQEKEESSIIISQPNSIATVESISTNTDQPKFEDIENEPVTTGLSEVYSGDYVASQESFIESESMRNDNNRKRVQASDTDAEAQVKRQKFSESDSQPAVNNESQVDREEIYKGSHPRMEPDFRLEYSKNHAASAEKSGREEPKLTNGVGFALTNGDVLKPERIEVIIPDMFVSFMAMTPKVNPHYEQARAESEKWIIDTCNMDAKTAKRVAQCNFSYFSAICAPDADPEGLRILCDWGNWVFPYDDMFDNGELRYDPEGGHKMIDATLSILKEGQEERVPETPLIYVHDTIWKRVLKNSPKGTQRRYKKAMIDYCNGAVEHVEDAFNGRIPPLEEYLAIHRKAAGVTPIIALVEYANKIDIPDYCFEHKSLQEITRVGTDVVLIQNDIVSYLKEETEGVNHNIVAVCRASGLSAQAAFDRVNELLQERYHDWYLAQAYLPQWGEEIDRQVQRYIKGVHETMLANLNFSFYSERYFGARRHITRKDRKVLVRKETPQASAGGA